MNKADFLAIPFDNVFDPGLLTEFHDLADELDLNAVLLGDALSVLPDFLLKRFDKLAVVEYFDLTSKENIVVP
jgi:hypothetical protein